MKNQKKLLFKRNSLYFCKKITQPPAPAKNNPQEINQVKKIKTKKQKNKTKIIWFYPYVSSWAASCELM